MRRYETIIIIDPDLSEERRTQLYDRMKDQIDQYQGFLVELDEWGNRKLAYNIRKKSRGHYLRMDYCGTADLVDELERQFKINEAYLKFMTVVIDKEADPEAIKAEVAAKAEAAEAAAKARAAEIEAAKAAAAASKESAEAEKAAKAAKADKPAEAATAAPAENAPETATDSAATPDEKEAS